MNILFLCTANLHRSRTAEDYFRSVSNKHSYKSEGLSEKLCKRYNTRLCSIELLGWADKIYVMETMHVKRISLHTRKRFMNKIENLNIDDTYQYMQTELLEKFTSIKQLLFIHE